MRPGAVFVSSGRAAGSARIRAVVTIGSEIQMIRIYAASFGYALVQNMESRPLTVRQEPRIPVREPVPAIPMNDAVPARMNLATPDNAPVSQSLRFFPESFGGVFQGDAHISRPADISSYL